MAEDQGEEMEEFVGGMGTKSPCKKPYKVNYEECNIRLDELAKPRKWYLLSTYQENKERFDPDRLDKIRARIQEEFSLTPEETEKYMERFKRKIKTDIRKQELLREIKKQKKLAKRKAYMVFRKYVKRGMMFACQHSPPVIVSPVVNSVSDAILKILCEIHNVPLPKRRDNDKVAQFLMANADWLAIAICSIYYDVEVDQRREIERQKQLEQQLEMEKQKEKKPPEEEIGVKYLDEAEEEEEAVAEKGRGEEAEADGGKGGEAEAEEGKGTAEDLVENYE